MVSLIMFPLAFGLGAVAQTVVQAFFNQKWADVGTMLVYLSVLSAPRPMAHILHQYFYSCGRPRIVLYLEWAALAAIILSIATIGRLGIDWTCGAVGSVFVLRTLAALWTAKYLDKIPMRTFLVPLLRPLVACAAMVASILAVRPALRSLSPAIRLVAEVGVGAAAYAAGALLIFRPAAREFFGLVRTALARR
jgi:O-antigen/teichoic acid export membrane protein